MDLTCAGLFREAMGDPVEFPTPTELADLEPGDYKIVEAAALEDDGAPFYIDADEGQGHISVLQDAAPPSAATAAGEPADAFVEPADAFVQAEDACAETPKKKARRTKAEMAAAKTKGLASG